MDALADHWLVSDHAGSHPAPAPDQWWYYALDGGQHVVLWTKRALQAVASQYGRHLVSTPSGLHLLSRDRVNGFWAAQILRGRGGFLLDRLFRRRSLLQADYRTSLARAIRHQSSRSDAA